MHTWDEPLLSPRRLWNAFRLYLYFVIHAPAGAHTLLWYLRWHRRKEALFRRYGPRDEMICH